MKIYNEVPLFDKKIDQPEPFITPFLLDGENNACVVVVPGGGYEVLAGHEGAPIAKWLNSIGLSAVVLNYRVAPYTYPAQLFDVQRAIKFVKANAKEFGVDTNKILVLGFSAGGHLAAMAGCFVDEGFAGDEVDRESSAVSGMILCYPVISMSEFTHKGSADTLCNGDKQLYHKLSIQNSVHKGMPPLFLWHTFDDQTVDIYNAISLISAYRENGLECEAHIFPHGRHGLGLAEDNIQVSSWTKLCENWLKSYKFID